MSDTGIPTTILTMRIKGVKDFLCFRAPHVDGSGYMCFGLPFSTNISREAKSKHLTQRLSVHAQSAIRIRRQLRKTQQLPLTAKLNERSSFNTPPNGAVFDARSQPLLDAKGDAQAKNAREELKLRVRPIDQARASRSGRSTEALELWQGLICGSWSAIDRHDSDERRYSVIHKNREDLKDPRGLKPDELRVAAYASRDLSNKLIADQLGISNGAVSALLSSAFTKLKVTKRTSLRKVLGF